MNVTLPAVVAMLERTPATLRAILEGVPDEWTSPSYGPGTWSAKEVVAHLIHGERTDWIPRLRIMLEHGAARPFGAFDRAGHAGLMSSSLAELLDVFERERAEGLRDLRALVRSEADLAREGRHPALGRVTIGNLLATWVVHDLNHIGQICKAMAWQYKAEVGPWEAYLSVLAPPNPR